MVCCLFYCFSVRHLTRLFCFLVSKILLSVCLSVCLSVSFLNLVYCLNKFVQFFKNFNSNSNNEVREEITVTRFFFFFFFQMWNCEDTFLISPTISKFYICIFFVFLQIQKKISNNLTFQNVPNITSTIFSKLFSQFLIKRSFQMLYWTEISRNNGMLCHTFGSLRGE